MAKTIEEKSNKKYNNPVEPYCFETDNEEQWYMCGLRDGYIESATDQRKIDIEKACEWLSTLPEQLDVYEDSHYVIDRDTLIEQFKQTMEE